MSDIGHIWARRRAAVKAEEQADERAAEEARAEQACAALAEKDDAEILAEIGLPNPDVMQQGDDFSGFMAREVPEHLRRRALRTLWRSNPVLACVDGLNEYDDDYRAAMLLQEPIKTAYQVGKGMLKHIEEMERKAEAQALAEAAPAEEAEPETAAAAVSDVATDTSDEVSEAEQHVAAAVGVAPEGAVEESVELSPAVPRRMRFRFEEASV